LVLAQCNLWSWERWAPGLGSGAAYGCAAARQLRRRLRDALRRGVRGSSYYPRQNLWLAMSSSLAEL